MTPDILNIEPGHDAELDKTVYRVFRNGMWIAEFLSENLARLFVEALERTIHLAEPSLKSLEGCWGEDTLPIIDLGGPVGGRYWIVTSDHDPSNPDAHAAAVYARAMGCVGSTYNDVTVKGLKIREAGV